MKAPKKPIQFWDSGLSFPNNDNLVRQTKKLKYYQEERRNNMYDDLGIGAVIIWVGISITALIGWVINLIAVINVLFTDAAIILTGKLLLRIIGIFVAPLGSILGLFF